MKEHDRTTTKRIQDNRLRVSLLKNTKFSFLFIYYLKKYSTNFCRWAILSFSSLDWLNFLRSPPDFAGEPLIPPPEFGVSHELISILLLIKKGERMFSLKVAGEGIEPPAFGLWAQRATTAPPRGAVLKSDAKVCHFSLRSKFLSNFFAKYFLSTLF